MPATQGQISRALNSGHFMARTLEEDDFNLGQFHDTELAANEHGVLAYLEVGVDDPVGDALAVLVGHFMGSNPSIPRRAEGMANAFLAGNTAVNRIEMDLQTDVPEDAQDSAKFGIGGVKNNTIAADNIKPETRASKHHPNLGTDIAVETPAEFGWRFVREGEFLTVVVNPGSDGAETYDATESEWEIPILAWDGRGL